MIYMNALLSRFGPNAVPAGAYFMQLQEETNENASLLSGPTLDKFAKDDKKSVTGEQFSSLLQTAADTAQRLASGILSGKIQASPLEDACRYCPYGALCGHECILDSKEES